MAMLLRRSSLLVLVVSSAFGCADGDPATCRTGNECASGECTNGQCTPVADGDSTGGDGGAGGGAGGDGATGGTGNVSAGGTGGEGAALCSPNGDGAIDRDEVTFAEGLNAKFQAASDVTFNTAGTDGPGGKKTWDLGQSFPGDHLTLIDTLDVSQQWFANSFAGATYAAKLSDSADLLGVFEATPTQLLLLGIVSTEDSAFATELEYAPPVVVLSFPLTMGASWQTTSTVTGFAQGVFSSYEEKYTSSVDAEGTVITPFGSFDVLRTHTQLERTIGLLKTTVQSFTFTSECFGTVARISSQDNETGSEFVNVAELSRLSP